MTKKKSEPIKKAWCFPSAGATFYAETLEEAQKLLKQSKKTK